MEDHKYYCGKDLSCFDYGTNSSIPHVMCNNDTVRTNLKSIEATFFATIFISMLLIGIFEKMRKARICSNYS